MPPPLRRMSSPAGDRTLEKDKRQRDFLPVSGNPKLVRSRKTKKRRQHRRKKERLRYLRRNGRNFRKRRRRLKQSKKSINTSVLSDSTLLDGQSSHSYASLQSEAVPSLSSLHNHNVHLLELLTGGNKEFLVLPRLVAPLNSTNNKVKTKSLKRHPHTKKLIFLPFKVVNGGSLEWLPYNPNIRVSIQVTRKQHYDRVDTVRQLGSPTEKQSKLLTYNIFFRI